MARKDGSNTYLEPLTAVGSADGRYHDVTAALSEHFSEYGLIRKRLTVECEYLIALSEANVGMRALTKEEEVLLRQLPQISTEEAQIVKKIEKEGYEGILATNHDVKAIEYFIKKKLEKTSLRDVAEWTHFALTSEDINSVAHAMALRGALGSAFSPILCEIGEKLDELIKQHAAAPMLARTHGQPATPTTFGKEMRVFVERYRRQAGQLAESSISVKFGGASGNWNAHVAALPDIDWRAFSRSFIARLNEGYDIKLVLNEVTTQIEPHDSYAELFDTIKRMNTVFIDLSQDMWRYISDGWLTQKAKEGEIGSSAMPHKVNPIDFENAEGNLGIANALFNHFSQKLLVSRLQRDLSDSTVERAFGNAFAHSLIAYTSLAQGLSKVAVNEETMLGALAAHPEVLAEAIQTILRLEGAEMPYEKLKELTRGKQVTIEALAQFVDDLEVSDDIKKRLKGLKPENYIGLAAEIARG